jgi:hypothetical protein
MTIEEAQEECKRRFPIGCKYRCVENNKLFTLINDKSTYSMTTSTIWAHKGAGLLYNRVNETFATLISLPKGYIKPKQPKPKKDDLKPLVKLLKEII